MIGVIGVNLVIGVMFQILCAGTFNFCSRPLLPSVCHTGFSNSSMPLKQSKPKGLIMLHRMYA